MHLCQQGGEAYLLAIFLRMRRMILPDLVFGSPVNACNQDSRLLLQRPQQKSWS